MYESAFGFAQRPFASAPLPDRYVPAGSIDHALQTLSRAIERAEGPGLLIGPAGTGKTLLCQILAARFRDTFRVVTLSTARLCTRRALLQNILFELGLPYRDLEEGELRLSLIDHLEPSQECRNGMLLLVDEANALPLRLLEEIRMITNLVRDGQPRVRLVLSGSPVLEERFANPKLESFNQRITARCYLNSLNREETLLYIRSQISLAGGDANRIFAADALVAVYRATDGIPRLINQVCDHALMMAALGNRNWIGAAGVEEAWADLQQLPAPWPSHARGSKGVGDKAATTNIVEFGKLEPDDANQTIPLTAVLDSEVQSPDPSSQLDEIERQLEEVELEREPALTVIANDVTGVDDEQFVPVGKLTPEVELVFHGPHDLFGDAFDEEEVVIDRYASIEAVLTGRRPRVASAEGSEISAALTPHIVPEVAEPTPDVVEQDEALAIADEVESAFDPASDPVMPEGDVVHVAESPRQTNPSDEEEFSGVSGPHRSNLRVAATDDRDLIVIDDDEPTPRERPRRREYRQLFANLRRG